MTFRYNPPPNWPAPPSPGWVPPQGWTPDSSWGPPPQGWDFWIDDQAGAFAVRSNGYSNPPGLSGRESWVQRHKIATGLGVFVLIGVVLSAVGRGFGDTSPEDGRGKIASTKSEATPSKGTTGPSAKRAAAPPAGQLKKTVRDGKFAFTVTKVKCGRTLVGTRDFGSKAQGEFCEVSISVQNVGDEAQSLFGDNQYLYDARNRKFSADTEAAIYLDESNTLYEEINPGNTLKGVLLFDVPKGTEPSKVELHDSVFSAGVNVLL
jgi:hypothetical protein